MNPRGKLFRQKIRKKRKQEYHARRLAKKFRFGFAIDKQIKQTYQAAVSLALDELFVARKENRAKILRLFQAGVAKGFTPESMPAFRKQIAEVLSTEGPFVKGAGVGRWADRLCERVGELVYALGKASTSSSALVRKRKK